MILACRICLSEERRPHCYRSGTEWVSAQPAQLFGSAPWWFLKDRSVNEAWHFQDGEPPEVTSRYFKYLEIFDRVLEEEEAKKPGTKTKSLYPCQVV